MRWFVPPRRVPGELWGALKNLARFRFPKFEHVVEVPLDYEEAYDLCHEALREAFGTITTDRDGDSRKIDAKPMLDDMVHGVRFSLEPEVGRTTIRVESVGLGNVYGLVRLAPVSNRMRRDQLATLAAYLAEHGGGRVVARSDEEP